VSRLVSGSFGKEGGGAQVKRWPAICASLPSPVVVGFWWFTIQNPWVMDRLELFPPFFLASCILGPLCGVGAVLCGRLVFSLGWREVWYAAPCFLGGLGAFAFNAFCFVVYIAPGC
jgi:hypothetical protein